MTSFATASDSQALKWELACEVLRACGGLPFRVTGWSMFPTIRPEDVLVVEPATSTDISAGDIVLYENGRQLVAHRVLTKVTSPAGVTIQTQGDAVAAADAPVSVGSVLGRVSYIQRNGRYIDVNRTPGIFKRAASRVFRSSRLAARVIVGLHGLQKRSQALNFSTQASSLQT